MKFATMILLELSALAVVGCALSPPPEVTTASAGKLKDAYPTSDVVAGGRRTSLDLGLAEAVFRYQFGEIGPIGRSVNAAFCIGSNSFGVTADPPAELLARLASERPAVLPQSACGFDGQRAFVKASRAGAIIFRIDEVICVSERQCTVRGGYLAGNLSSSINAYEVQEAKGNWRVISEMVEVAS